MNKNSIYGAIIGDIVGSHLEVAEIVAKMNKSKVDYETRQKILDKNTPLFTPECSLTDDSVLTIAIADALTYNGDYEQKLKEYGKKEINMGVDKYGRSRFGKCFAEWIYGDYIGDSWGNGCAMRVSPLGYAFDTLEQTLKECDNATICSHNHPDSLKCARAVAGAIYLARTGSEKQQIQEFVEKELDLKLEYDLQYLSKEYNFTSKAMLSVPQAIYCFLVSDDFEDCIRKTISIGGDVDTTAAISGSIASAFYDIPEDILKEAKEFISPEYEKVLQTFSKKYLDK